MITTRQFPPAKVKQLMVVLAYDKTKNLWLLPGGQMSAKDNGALPNTAARETGEELHRLYDINDLTNLNRSYYFGQHIVYVFGDKTCKGLFFLDGTNKPKRGYKYPSEFKEVELKKTIQTAQSKIPNIPANSHKLEVNDVKLFKIKTILAWLGNNNILDPIAFPAGAAVPVTDPHDGKIYPIDYWFLWTLQQATMIESPGCSAICMFTLMNDPLQRLYNDTVLAPYFQ
ncbi:NUDIX hydrolase [Spongorhabdus nitratireducens]